MKRKQLTVIIALVLWVFVAGYAQAEWITLDYPGSSATYPYGIDGDNIVGSYVDSSGKTHGFLYNGTSWTTLDYPGSLYYPVTWSTEAHGIDGSNIVGTYIRYPGDACHGFFYNGTAWSEIGFPKGNSWLGNHVYDIDDGNIVGTWGTWWWQWYGFLARPPYDWTSFTSIEYGSGTSANAIDGDIIVCTCYVGWPEGFIYDGTNWTSLGWGKFPNGIDDGNIVGNCGSSGFLYDGTNWIWLVYPGSFWTSAEGIDGDRIVGSYGDASGVHGFLYQPDVVIPATIELSPDTINLRSKVKWITCYIELLEGYHAADIDVSTVKLNGEVSAESEPTAIGDYDSDGITDLMVKFDRTAVQGLLQIGDVEITVTGELNDGTPFEGSDTIRVINPGK